jgi:hypothetical protein
MVVVWPLFVVVILKALVCLLPVKNGHNNVGISTISFSGFGPNPAGFAQIRAGYQFIWSLYVVPRWKGLRRVASAAAMVGAMSLVFVW